jgi:DNA-binding Xre family transcriptional regulator
MSTALRIKQAAKERGVTLSSLAKALGMHRANMSAIASGTRGASLNVLKAICGILDCGLDEIVAAEPRRPVFKDKNTQSLLDDVEGRNYDGMDKTWVNRLMLARIAHYRSSRRSR